MENDPYQKSFVFIADNVSFMVQLTAKFIYIHVCHSRMCCSILFEWPVGAGVSHIS